MTKVKSTNYGITSDLATCRGCRWDFDGYMERGIVRAIKKHVRETRHNVNREVVKAIDYSPNDPDKQ